MNKQRIKLDRLLNALVKKHRKQAFTPGVLRGWLVTEGIDLATAIGIIKVIVWLWPKKRISGPPTCRKYIRQGKQCGAAIVHSELREEPEGQLLVLVCERKHVTKKPMAPPPDDR